MTLVVLPISNLIISVMSLLKVTIPITILTFFLACGEKDMARNFSMGLEGKDRKYAIGTEINVRIDTKKELPVDSAVYYLDDSKLEVKNGKISLESKTLGTHILTAKVFSEGREISLREEILILAKNPPEVYTYEIVNTYPHDREAFTQGLEFVGDTLYESTGIKGESSLRKVDYKTGRVVKQTNLEANFFGEGITVLGDTIFMLTWQSGKGLLFNPKTLEQIGSFNYRDSKEGWGFCNDGKVLYKSDGTQRIWKLDPKSLNEIGYIETVTNSSIFNKTNELEFIDGKIYANVWQKPSMMIIDAQTGAIEGVVNFGGLDKKVTQHETLDVLNGVAYHKERNTFFVTGKRWDKIFEVRLVKRNP
jgi:glutamine cyclotransferase